MPTEFSAGPKAASGKKAMRGMCCGLPGSFEQEARGAREEQAVASGRHSDWIGSVSHGFVRVSPGRASGKIACISPSRRAIQKAPSPAALSHKSGLSRIIDTAWPGSSSLILTTFHAALAGSPWTRLLRILIISRPAFGSSSGPIRLSMALKEGPFHASSRLSRELSNSGHLRRYEIVVARSASDRISTSVPYK